MFLELVEYDDVIEKIKEYNLTESQTNTLIKIISENPTLSVPKLLEITNQISKNEIILLDRGTYSIDPILNESKNINLLEIALPIILKYIPEDVIGYLTEYHISSITDKIFEVEFDENTSPQQLKQRIDEMFSSGDISIPVQGLRTQKISPNIILNGVIAQKLHKGIQFGKEFHKHPINSFKNNRNVLRNALKDFNMVNIKDETPLTKLLPKFIVVLKNLTGEK